MAKITREQAEAEMASWLDKKKVFDETRDTFKQNTDILVEAIMNQALVVTPEFELVHTLLFPLSDEIKSLKYRLRMNDNFSSSYMKGLKQDDVDGRINGLIAALTETSRGVVTKLDSSDKRIATAIAVFFM